MSTVQKGPHDDTLGAASKRRRLEVKEDDNPSLGRQLIHAAQHAELENVTSLVERGASLRVTQDGKSPLDYAIKANCLPVVEYLLAHGAEPTFDGLRNSAPGQGAPPIVSAARRGNVSILRAILAASADVNQTGGIGQTALHTAAYYGHRPFVVALLSAQAIVDAETTFTGNVKAEGGGKTKMWKSSTPLHLAASAGHAAVVQTLLRGGSRSINALTGKCFPQSVDRDGVFTPLHLAVRAGSLAAARALLRAGARLDVAGSYDGTPFDWAVSCRNPELMALCACNAVLTPADHLSLQSSQPGPTACEFEVRVKFAPHRRKHMLSTDEVMDHSTAALLAGLLANATYPAPLALRAAELRLVVRDPNHF